jgi:hypothetical protein
MSTPSISQPTSLKMARSPIFVTAKNNAVAGDTLESMTNNLRIYAGDFTTTGTNNYTLSKDYSINNVINFEVSNLIRSEFSHNFGVYNASFYEQSPLNEVLWVWPFGEWYYNNAGGGIVAANWNQPEEEAPEQFITTQGWADKFNPTNPAVTTPVLALSRDRQVLSSNFESLAIYNSAANDLGFITITWNNGDSDFLYDTDGIDSTPPDPSSGDTQDLVIYAGIGPANLDANVGLDASIQPINHSDGDYYDVILKNTGGDVIASAIHSCMRTKVHPYQVSFVTAMGLLILSPFLREAMRVVHLQMISTRRVSTKMVLHLQVCRTDNISHSISIPGIQFASTRVGLMRTMRM